jgi:hypothetical protein
VGEGSYLETIVDSYRSFIVRAHRQQDLVRCSPREELTESSTKCMYYILQVVTVFTSVPICRTEI